MWLGGKPAYNADNSLFLRSNRAYDRDGKISQSGHHAGPASLANPTVIFVEGHVSDVVSCLDVPVVPNDREKFVGTRFLRCEAGDDVDDLHRGFVRFDNRSLALDPCDLTDMRKLEIAIQLRARGDPASFNTAMSLLVCFMLRGGKNRPGTALRCPCEALADCP